jgi:hypothetical protein
MKYPSYINSTNFQEEVPFRTVELTCLSQQQKGKQRRKNRLKGIYQVGICRTDKKESGNVPLVGTTTRIYKIMDTEVLT